MRLTNKTKIALTALVAVQRMGEGSPVRLADIAQSMGVSLSYLEQIFARFRQAGIIKTFKGPNGGATVNGEVTVTAVVNAVTEPRKEDNCEVWERVSSVVIGQLDNMTIQSLAAKG
ncbi:MULTISPECIES: Rrf2 family transcriptional regulator [unclassified Vibrio]|uniref:RrF2 family transcriptional regulator n=1 Tax=unclassified Vibrio TaxID=2614977 RepID=UPI001268DC6A|nr:MULTISPECIES: Rrf2 family transcriptional regulator [unclassified Vibrio]QFT40069.1 HTH-type transcriptional regulator IscR [Vibrio sp. THAF64]QGM38014.1 HTH-type transcriptional regulator IscR [Vibrio sp. THAF191d]QGN73526.1 HTH-type transcriptional regulator IscR [Vibrio sp. THAF191c]